MNMTLREISLKVDKLSYPFTIFLDNYL
ncbi:hypothetical protein XBP1_2880050 [Xenorhabdus bovienii str. puntauvense]|uniref:Uncharacterized protein n=3 Tax=Xenorhabdus bovienii TaxID=40576 RepID=A0A0B6X9W2_XENBV|nr:hypothetical protein XBFFR1_1880002 [Xenorhabdus bovienii str. feltiae France]CDG91713.1 hypothetical protein XBFFL1_1740018 [Xenorhabdus bovienii str. feltiae Florida]CDG97947.1 hypothetical protein XBP1_2880050 [Xenorhabdus bovienii str. puntauvense]CDH02455.1 hypothetical protein XBFM1_2680014 [Xenorhabdus bovienii str. feltiae Moldova]CDM90667.1 protein of unknown function [Xenorhabdus bovienii]